jgi:hypothetical protein
MAKSLASLLQPALQARAFESQDRDARLKS